MDLDFYDLLEAVHRKMERGEKYYTLLSDKPKWNQLCASLYAIEDAQSAIDAYTEYEFPPDISGKYLYIYGLLQALYLQQDAANGLSIALFDKKIDFRKDYPAVYEIREIRNDTTGHPTGRNRKIDAGQSFVQIAQASMDKHSFSYAIYKESNDYVFEEKIVDLDKCILEQKKSVINILNDLCVSLDADWKKHIEKFQGKEMINIFDYLQLQYAKNNALENGVFASAGLLSSKKMVEQCKQALTERFGDWKNIDCFRYEIEDIEEIYQLLDLQKGDTNTRINHFLTEMLFVKMDNLAEYAKEIDEKFQST